eukprot:s1201_g9.t2
MRRPLLAQRVVVDCCFHPDAIDRPPEARGKFSYQDFGVACRATVGLEPTSLWMRFYAAKIGQVPLSARNSSPCQVPAFATASLGPFDDSLRNLGVADGDESRADAFLRFMAQTDRYSRLNGGGAAPSGRPRVSLVRDFPFTLVEKTPGDASKSSSSFLDRLAAMINAGSVQRAVLSFNDSRDDHRIITRLLQPVVYSAVAQVVFDGLPRTFAQKALDSLTTAQGLPSGAANTAALAAESGGDLRQAINALQLWTGSQRCAPTTSVNTRARNRGSTEKRTKAQLLAEAPRDAEASLRMANLGLFHALGRLLWCKRIPPGGDEVEMSAGGTKRRRKATTSGSTALCMWCSIDTISTTIDFESPPGAPVASDTSSSSKLILAARMRSAPTCLLPFSLDDGTVRAKLLAQALRPFPKALYPEDWIKITFFIQSSIRDLYAAGGRAETAERMRHYGAQEHLVVNVTRPLDSTRPWMEWRVG